MIWAPMKVEYKEREASYQEVVDAYNSQFGEDYKPRTEGMREYCAKLKEIMETVVEGDKLFWYSDQKENRGYVGYYRMNLLPDGTKQYLFTIMAWMS